MILIFLSLLCFFFESDFSSWEECVSVSLNLKISTSLSSFSLLWLLKWVILRQALVHLEVVAFGLLVFKPNKQNFLQYRLLYTFWKYYTVTAAHWCLCSFKKRVGMCVTHRLSGFAVGWKSLLLQSRVLRAGVRRRGEGMRKRSACRQLTGYSQVSASKQEERKNLNLAEILFRAYHISVVHGAPWVEVRSFFFYLFFSDQTQALSCLFFFFFFFSVVLILKTQLAWLMLFWEAWIWHMGCLCVASVCLLRPKCWVSINAPLLLAGQGFPGVVMVFFCYNEIQDFWKY